LVVGRQDCGVDRAVVRFGCLPIHFLRFDEAERILHAVLPQAPEREANRKVRRVSMSPDQPLENLDRPGHIFTCKKIKVGVFRLVFAILGL
jgi:hypothetical protein